VIIQCNSKSGYENDSVFFTYEAYAKVTYVKIRTYVYDSKIKYGTFRMHRQL